MDRQKVSLSATHARMRTWRSAWVRQAGDTCSQVMPGCCFDPCRFYRVFCPVMQAWIACVCGDLSCECDGRHHEAVQLTSRLRETYKRSCPRNRCLPSLNNAQRYAQAACSRSNNCGTPDYFRPAAGREPREQLAAQRDVKSLSSHL